MSILFEDQHITVPIATECTRSATLTLPWFIQRTTYDPTACSFEALVNGEAAFGAIHDAIEQATKSIDIICWGFQPSMYFKRGHIAGNLAIGQLLDKKAEKKGIKVRLLRWKSTDNLAQFIEDPAPGANPIATTVDHVAAAWNKHAPKDLRTPWQRDFDAHWYRRAQIAGNPLLPSGNLICATRDMNLMGRAHTATHTGKQTKDPQATGMMSLFPTHHQKMVLIDYEDPAQAVGFVMGHNMLDAYWDNDGHGATRQDHDRGRNGATPRQDISSRLHGPILISLNHNFCQAWDQATGEGLLAKRKAFEAAHQPVKNAFPRQGGTSVMAQILRTQPEHDETDIQRGYAVAVNNTTNYLYIENQYFRYPKLAAQIKAAVQRQVNAGRPTDQYPIHLFVVTNASDEGIGPGTLRTYELLHALGRPDVMPGIALATQKDNLQQQYQEACNAEVRAHAKANAIAGNRSPYDTPAQRQANNDRLKAAQAQGQQAKDKQAELQQKMKDATQQQQALQQDPDAAEKTVLPAAIPGLKAHICSLVAPDSPAENWMPVYIHAKLMLIDDTYTMLGSANINVRSMEADSELNICHERSDATQPLRKKLWNLHTNKQGGQDNVGEAFKKWGDIIRDNKYNRAKKLRPIASLVGFIYTGTERKSLD
ncbi:phosphatidylserine/phosphatidylglycerophosphate/cardiolipin synthase family protein [Herbaspirillum sp. RV1423]|uniref:phospholipase D-like domain-containing protein n=1 Tax=Herbaspirillum sp. RV1423 TaxID=1443993 RepID=UPI0004B7F4C0|nr:phosphatidylserine/phosphatidylglycerophosphate/cardiolipin synthase family protein [Herbaspirillum sp. RV1423]